MVNNLTELQILEIVTIHRKEKRIQTKNKDCYVISCRTQGESAFFYNDRTYWVRRGDVLFIPAGFSYCQECQQEELIAVHLNISGDLPDNIRIFTPDDPDGMCALFKSLAHAWQENAPSAMYQCMSDLYKILALSNVTVTPERENCYGVISPSIAYLQAHLFDKDLSLDTVYRQSPVCHTSFIKRFREHFHCTPIKYVNQRRIQKAQILLESRAYTREEIAELCGFESIKHFYMLFKKITGCTTGEYLKSRE